MPESLHENGLSAALLNRTLSGYSIVREVGHGSMGVVYEARQNGVGRRVAIKCLPPNMALRDRTVKRFLREAEAMGRLSHPNIVDIHEVGTAGSISYFSMKFVEGPPLDRVLKAGPLAIADVLAIGIDVSSALAHAHSRGVLHRDIKPSNLLRDGDRVMLTDFGLARPLDQEEAGTMTESGDLVGTPLYMSPEQISGSGDAIDGRSDVWGLGATLYELLVQRAPFGGPNAQTILNAILTKDPVLPHKLRDDVPRDLEAVLLKCLEKDVERRYATAAGLLEDLRAVRDGRPVSARPPRFFDPALRWMRRNPVEAGVGVLLLGVAAIFAVVWQSSQQQVSTVREEKRTAEQARDALQTAMDLAAARAELLSASRLWRTGVSDDQGEAFERVANVIEEYETRSPEIVLEAVELTAQWFHERSQEDEGKFVQKIELMSSGQPLERRLAFRAAMYTGSDLFEEAIKCHEQRARLSPRNPEPLLSAVPLHRRLARKARDEEDTGARLRETSLALSKLRAGLDLAVSARNETLVVRALIERARILVDLDQPTAALNDIRAALAKDPTRVEARALRSAAERRAEVLATKTAPTMKPTDVAQKDTAGREAPTSLLGVKTPDVLELTRTKIEDTGKNLRSIYRGFKDILTAPIPQKPTDAKRE
ncbi:MAG: serine/threonine protein kinase [Planctomycetes bacterium]|nr:serine/threonine protein kinase [Planctomycetota bacterium]